MNAPNIRSTDHLILMDNYYPLGLLYIALLNGFPWSKSFHHPFS